MIIRRLISILFNNNINNNNNINLRIKYNLKYLIIIITILGLVNINNGLKLSLDNYNVPCGYFDTVDLRNSTKLSNGSYLYDDIVIPSPYIGIYDYELINTSYRISVEPHLRGCACELTSKKCIRWCCGSGEIMSPYENTCVKINDTYSNEMEIHKHDGEIITRNISEYFISQKHFRPCEEMYFLSKTNEDDKFKLIENGDIMLLYDEKVFDKNYMCFGYAYDDEPDDIFNINSLYSTIYLCESPAQNSIRIILNAYAMLFSIPFMVITILVYTLIPELRNLHGKSLSCYLLGLVFGYSLMCSQVFHMQLCHISCQIIGFVTYFSFMSAFFWLSVISFDLWWNFRGTRGRNLRDTKKFLVFSLYAWGLALVCTGVTVFAQLTDYVPDQYKPGIGGGNYCWLDVVENYSALAYFYGPVLAIITFNVIMFIITSLKIHHVQREVARMIAREDSRKNLRSEKDSYGLFLRLFIVMGVTWSMEIISYLIGENHIFNWFFYVIDICNAVQGFLIFTLFVLKKKVKHLIFKRFKQARGINRASQYSTKTTCSNITLTTLSHSLVEKPLMDPKSVKE